MGVKFIRVTKDTATRERGFIAVDAICSVFENKDKSNVSIMTMDGFWYDVVDDIEKLWELVAGKMSNNTDAKGVSTKQEYCRRKKMLAAPCVDKLPVQGDPMDTICSRGEIHRGVGKDTYIKKKVRRFVSDLPTGVGKEHRKVEGGTKDGGNPSSVNFLME